MTNNECAICMEEFDETVVEKKSLCYNHCAPIYIHFGCLIQWILVNRNSCILCRKTIPCDSVNELLLNTISTESMDDEEYARTNGIELLDHILSYELYSMNENNELVEEHSEQDGVHRTCKFVTWFVVIWGGMLAIGLYLLN